MATMGRSVGASSLRIHCNQFLTQSSRHNPEVALVLLNNEYSPWLLRTLWQQAGLRVCADGGANRLKKMALKMVPDVITGDLDSLCTEVRTYYEQRGCHIIEDDNQNRHDLDKALHAVTAHDGFGPCCTVVVLGAFGGRFDHEIAAIQALYRHAATFDRLLLVGDHALAELLSPGSHELWPNTELEGKACGLLPIGTIVQNIKTVGLRWDLNDCEIGFGKTGVVSTSNLMDKRRIQVTTSDPVIWTTEVNIPGNMD